MNMHFSHYQHWTQEEMHRLHLFSSYAEASKFAMQKLRRLAQPVAQVCGPLTTGGRGSYEANVQMMHDAICLLAARGRTIFDQRPFEIPMLKILRTRAGDDYDYSLLAEFYLPLFESGLIREFHFLPGWESSIGARWEHEQGERLEIEIFYMPEHLLRKN